MFGLPKKCASVGGGMCGCLWMVLLCASQSMSRGCRSVWADSSGWVFLGHLSLGGGVKKHRKVASGDSSSVEAGKGKSQFVLGCWQALWKDERVKWDKT